MSDIIGHGVDAIAVKPDPATASFEVHAALRSTEIGPLVKSVATPNTYLYTRFENLYSQARVAVRLVGTAALTDGNEWTLMSDGPVDSWYNQIWSQTTWANLLAVNDAHGQIWIPPQKVFELRSGAWLYGDPIIIPGFYQLAIGIDTTNIDLVSSKIILLEV